MIHKNESNRQRKMGSDRQTDSEPHSKTERRHTLVAILNRQDVRYPIAAAVAQKYLDDFDQEIPFGIGALASETVDLQGYEDRQNYDALTSGDHLSWADLVQRQQQQKTRYACSQYIQGEEDFEIKGKSIPDYYLLNARIYQQTGWQLATVSEIIPAHVFFHCHSRKFFPVTTFMRPFGTDYLEEPDIGHDIAGHVATFTIPEVAFVMNQHGLVNESIQQEKASKLKLAGTEDERLEIEAEARELLLYAGRLYWFTVEFGLVLQDGQLKAFGAGILSSPGETVFSVDSQQPNRIVIDPSSDRDLLRLATTDYLISEFQKTYFVLKDFDTLLSLTADRILKVIKQAQRLPHLTWREIVAGDRVHNVGKTVMGPNEKYVALKADLQIDDCLTRTAKRNLAIYDSGIEIFSQEEQNFIDRLPELPFSLEKRKKNESTKKCGGKCSGCRSKASKVDVATVG